MDKPRGLDAGRPKDVVTLNNRMRSLNAATRRLWLFALIAGLTMAGRSAGQSARPANVVADIARAEQLYDQANYRQAAAILRRVVNESSRSGASRESVAALRLLAQVYYRSTDFERAVEAGEVHARLSPDPDAEMALLLADSYLALRRYDEAAGQLQKFRAADDTLGELREARLAADAERIEAALRRSDPAKREETGAWRDERATLAVVPEKFEAAQRFQAVNFLVGRYQGSGQFEDAIALLEKEIASRAFNDVESTELNLKLADCYKRQAARHAESRDNSAHRAAIARQQAVLDRVAANLQRRRSRGGEKPSADPAEDYATLLAQEATLYELRAELARGAAPASKKAILKHLTLAVKSYRELLQHSSNQGLPPGRANHFRDTALCGLQRVYEALRSAAASHARDSLFAELRKVSDALVAERSARLLPADPALRGARLAQASIYASLDDRASHQRAADIYRDLAATAQAGADPQAQAAVLVGLAEVLRGLDETRAAYQRAQEAKQLMNQAPPGDDAESRREHALLMARIENSLGVSSIALGQYQEALQHIGDADRRLRPYGEAAAVLDPGFSELRRRNHDALHVLSRVKVYRGLLHKAEAQYEDAANRIREGRELREKLDADADLLAYYLAEASVHLALANARMHEARAAADEPAVRDALAAAKIALDRAHPLTDATELDNAPRQMAAALPYRFLRALLARLQGDRDASRQAFAALAEESQLYGDHKIAAKCLMQLAQLSVESLANSPPTNASRAADSESATSSRTEIEELRQFKLDRREAVGEAAEYAAQAVALFQNMDLAETEDEEAVTALPSLHFQAAFLAARLHVLIAALDHHIGRLNELLEAESSSAAESRPEYNCQQAIDFLEDAVLQAERPASSTTQVRLQRAKFFSRYAPAYDLLVDLHVSAAIGNGNQLAPPPDTEAYTHLRRAIEVADLARNRTFREQIEGWRESAGKKVDAQAFDWEADIAELAAPGSVVLMYHLDGPQLLNAGGGRLDPEVARIGGGHLFAIRDEGRTILYYRLQHAAADDAQPGQLTRELAADLVRRQVGWIEEPEAAPDWGRDEQRALTAALLPRELLASFVNSPGPDSSASLRQLLIIPDGALHQLPFESLLLPQGIVASRSIRYVLDEFPPIRYGPSLSVVAAIGKTVRPADNVPQRLLTVGDPAYPDRGEQKQIPAWGELFRQIPDYGAGFPALTHSAEECQSVYASFSAAAHANRIMLSRDSATEAAVRRHIPGSHYIHLAAHGCVDYQNDNLFGALVFAPGDDRRDPHDDGLLQLRDIYDLDLSQCELAVLSACETYVGPERPLEAGTSMARAFLEQGAKRVVCSQWGTDDQATTKFMKVFFQSIRRSRQSGDEVDYARALHEAKLALRGDPGRGSLPKYWSPFVLVGAR